MREAVRRLRGQGVEALVIHFMHSYANDAHERQAREIAAHAVAQRLHHRGIGAPARVPRVRARHDRGHQRRSCSRSSTATCARLAGDLAAPGLRGASC